MNKLPEIHELGQVILPALNGGSLISYEVEHLTQLGDNYGSVLISIRAQIKQPNGELFAKRLVAKVPPTDPKYWQFIQPERTCLAENAVYEKLAPAIKALEEEAGIPQEAQFDGFARYFGSRISLKPNSSQVDNDAILVLDDLRYSGYLPGRRLQPFDLLHTQLVLKYMARFHALTIALRLRKPQLFEMEVRPFFDKFDWHAAAPESKATMIAETLTDIREATGNDEGLVELVSKLSKEFFSFLARPPNENNAFNSVIHSDLWTMNLMFKYDHSGNPTQLKIIDFQTSQFDSVIHDLISFLLTSVSTSVLEENYEHLLQVYYDAFIDSLLSVGADTTTYSYDAFRAELKLVGYIQVPHSIFMTRFILANDVPATDNDLDLNDVLKTNSSQRVHRKLIEIWRLAQKFEILH
ncbi:uncharacterized protein LOC6561916 [Drosophila grimshawi]|uniref:GH11715 n=1 Tax=Drosophila grimshawi TaxID=7222 RepID=B4JD46_DROGR|nr:uncharacterized protein LOC6561916 [Drosophila grimshawi]EDW04290.1 GH11715 [Drosophila grimshawi]